MSVVRGGGGGVELQERQQGQKEPWQNETGRWKPKGHRQQFLGGGLSRRVANGALDMWTKGSRMTRGEPGERGAKLLIRSKVSGLSG